MKEMDNNGLNLCEIQANIFADTLKYTKCSSAVFIRRFMYSRFAQRMDAGSILYESTTSSDAFDEIENEYGKTEYGKERYSYDELYWMGYIYRYWCYTYQTESKNVYKIITAKELRQLYFPYHTMSIENAIERILEAKNIINENMTEKGVKILRRILNTKKSN